MLSYYKNVFLWPIRFSFIHEGFFGDLFGSILGGAATGAASTAASGLVGGSSTDTSAEQMAQLQAEKDKAGGKGTITSVPQVESFGTSTGKAIKEFGLKMANDFMTDVSKKFVSNTVEGIFNKKVDPFKQGMRQRAFTSRAFPGVNPWELSGGAGGGSGGVGGTAAPMIQARASRQVAHVAAEPKLKKVAIEYQKAPHEIAEIDARTGVHKAQEVLSRLESDWLPTMKQAQSNLETTAATKNVVEQQKILQGVELERQKIATELQKTGLTKYNKQVQKAYSNILKPVADSQGLANLVLAIGGILGIFKGIPAISKIFKGKGLKKKVAPRIQ